MCGIFGAAAVTRPVDVDAALASIAHRGPDAHGSFRVGDTVLGHTRLSIIDLSDAAGQPMVSPDGQVALTFNGEIYNHHALRDELVARGHRFRSRGDTEVILEGYLEWGDGVVERLDGMFAFGIWDERRRRLLLARDRPGKKPLFYARDGHGLRFASEIKAMTASGLAAEPDVSALPFVLTLGYVPAPHTMYAGVSQLPPASLLVWEPGREPVVRRYWHAPFSAAPISPTVDEATREVRRLVEAAVERRLEADVPLGAFLSGGVDSTIIVGVMARLAGHKVRTFSIGFAGDPRYDETRYARLAATAFGTEHTEFTLEPSSFELVERLVALHDGPFGDSSAIPTSVVSELTRRQVTVALTGDGGDELFCGYHRFLAAEAAERIPLPLRRAGAAIARLLPRGASDRTLGARIERFASAAALPLADRLTRWTSFFYDDLDRILRRDVAATLDLAAPTAWSRALGDECAAAGPLARVLDHNFNAYLPYDLLVKADRSSMAHSLETRSPFLDTALIEYTARLPAGFKRRGTTTKWILKRAFADLLPAEIVNRPKMGFGVPLGTWFRGNLKQYLGDHLGRGAALDQYLDAAYVERLLNEHFAGRADHGGRLWLLLTLEVWLRSLGRAARARAA